MEGQSANATFNADLVTKAYVKLHDMGLDLNYFLKRIVDDDLTNDDIKILFILDKIKNDSFSLPNIIPTHIEEYLNLIPNEEVERRIKQAKSKGHISDIKGIFNGMIWKSDDFDEPLDCMKEYME